MLKIYPSCFEVQEDNFCVGLKNSSAVLTWKFNEKKIDTDVFEGKENFYLF